MRCDFQLTVEDVARWQRYAFLSPRLTWWTLFAVWAVVGFFTIVRVQMNRSEALWKVVAENLFWAPVYTLFVAAVFWFIQSRSRAERILNDQPSLRGPVWFEFDESGFRAGGAHQNGETRWGAITGVVETESLIFLKFGPQVANVIPKRALSEGRLDELRAFVRKAEKDITAGGWAGRWS